jgi:hypothetical protein
MNILKLMPGEYVGAKTFFGDALATSAVKFSDTPFLKMSRAALRWCGDAQRRKYARRRWKGGALPSGAGVTATVLTGVMLSSEAATAAGPYRTFQSGLWSGGAYIDDRTGAFSHCSAGVAYDSGLNMFIVSTQAHGWWLGFTNPQWSLTANASLPVKLRFDQEAPWDAFATIPNGQLLLVPMPDDPHLIDTFRHSSRLTVIAQQPSFSLSLGGTSNVISQLTKCVRNAVALEAPAPASPLTPSAPASAAPETAVATEPPASPPAAPEAPTAPAASAPIGPTSTLVVRDWAELEEVRLTKSFLMAAHLPNAHLVDTDKPAALASFRAVWRSDDAAGAVKIIPPARDATGSVIASELISVDPKLCKGNFAAARSHDVVDNAEVYRAVLSCADGQSKLTAQYFITPRQQGGFVVFAVIGDTGAPDRPAADGEMADLFDRAAVQAVASEE